MNFPTPLCSFLLSVSLFLPLGFSFLPPPLSVFCFQFSELIYIINSFSWFYFNSLWRLFLSDWMFPPFLLHDSQLCIRFLLICFCPLAFFLLPLSFGLCISLSLSTTLIITTVCLALIASNYVHYMRYTHLLRTS